PLLPGGHVGVTSQDHHRASAPLRGGLPTEHHTGAGEPRTGEHRARHRGALGGDDGEVLATVISAPSARGVDLEATGAREIHDVTFPRTKPVLPTDVPYQRDESLCTTVQE